MNELGFDFDIIEITETKITNACSKTNLNIPGYSFEYVTTPIKFGGVGMYINSKLNYSVIEKTSNRDFQALWVEMKLSKRKNIICSLV